MRTLRHLPLIAALAGGLLSQAPPAWAVSTLTGCFDVLDGSGDKICAEFKVDSLGRNVVFAAIMRGAGPWTIASGVRSGDKLTAAQTVVTGGQTVGGAYRTPSAATGTVVEIDWGKSEALYDNKLVRMSERREEITTGGLTAGVPFDFPADGLYAHRIWDREPNAYFEYEYGVGYFNIGQGTAQKLYILAYDTAGSAVWYSISGTYLNGTGATGVSILTGPLKRAGVTDVGTITVQSRTNATLALFLPGELLPTQHERQAQRFNFTVN